MFGNHLHVVQELFLGQLYDLHHTVQLQRHLVSICSHRDAMNAELRKLEAEQRAHCNKLSDMTVEQVRHALLDIVSNCNRDCLSLMAHPFQRKTHPLMQPINLPRQQMSVAYAAVTSGDWAMTFLVPIRNYSKHTYTHQT